MNGYIYITGDGADPAARNNLNDPLLFSKTPTLGACMPNIRRAVKLGDYIFIVSAKLPVVQQYVIGGIRVADKIDALTAYNRFPENRLHRNGEGQVWGNVIVNKDGTQHPLDHHSAATFENRVRNFIVGAEPVVLETAKEVEMARDQSLSKLSKLLGKSGNRMIDVMGRCSKLDEKKVHELLDWLRGIKTAAAR